MKVLKIEPKDRLTEYTHIEIQGVTIPIKSILNAHTLHRKGILTICLKNDQDINMIRVYYESDEDSDSVLEQINKIIKG